ncbi:MAG: hypothetical protein U5N58_02120 [Actinomycetota bacterium]|nr:hypothetical protein [Actinomycetota bacterium]
MAHLDFNGLGSLVRLFLEVVKSPTVLLGLFLYVISAALWLIVLSSVDLSFAYPLYWADLCVCAYTF